MLKRNWPVTAAVALGLALAAFALVALLARRDTRLAGTNSFVAISGLALPVAPGQQRCAAEPVPDGADRVRLYAGTPGPPRPPVEVVVLRDGRPAVRGRVPGGVPATATLDVPLRPRTTELRHARVCVRNIGPGRVLFAANRTPLQPGPRAGGPDEVRLDWLLPGRPTWAGVAPRVADRFAAAKPTFVGPWTMWAVGAALAALWAASIALVVREARR